MEDNSANDVDSLFEGMDFVMPISSPRELNDSTEVHDTDTRSELLSAGYVEPPTPTSDAYLQRSASALSAEGALFHSLSEPLDESLFSGLDMSMADTSADEVPISTTVPILPQVSSEDSSTVSKMSSNAADAAVRSPSSKNAHDHKKPNEGSMEKSSFESIMAAYSDPAGGRANNSSAAQVSRPTNIRRKKRSMKIGYGREALDYEEDAQSKAADKAKIVSIKETIASYQGLGTNGQAKSEIVTDNLNEEATLHPRTSQVKAECTKNLDLEDNIPSTSPQGGLSQVTAGDMTPETAKLPSSISGTELVAQGLESSADPVESGQYRGVFHTISQNETAAVSEIVLETGAMSFTGNIAVPETESSGEGIDANDAPQQPEKTDAQVSLAAAFENIKSSVAMRLKALDEKRTSASILIKAAVKRKRDMVEAVSVATTKLRELEAQLQSASEIEDFERADVLSEQAKEAEIALEAASTAFRDAEADCDFATEELQRVLDSQLAIQEEGIHLIMSLKQEADHEARRVEETAAEEVKTETETLTAEEEALELKKSKAMLELRVIEESKMELNICIESSTADEIKEKSGLTDRQDQLNAELERLLFMVKAKELEIAENAEKISQVDDKIANIAAKFEKQQEQLATESEAATAMLHELKEESEHLAAQKSLIEDRLSHQQETVSALLRISTVSSNEATAMQQVVDVRRAAARVSLLLRRKKVHLAEIESHALQECQTLRKDASSARSALQELSAKKEKLQQEISAAKQTILFVEKRGPELDSEKRLAAGSRNFKEAARLAAEAKALVADKEAATTIMTRMVNELEKLDEEAEDRIKNLTDLESLVTSREKDAAMARCERLRLLAAAARDERDAAAELEDFAEAESLDLEAEALDVEADDLRKLFALQDSRFDRLLSLPLLDGCPRPESVIVEADDTSA